MKVDLIQKERPELAILVQFPGKPSGIITLVEGVRRQVKRIIVLKRVLPEQNGLAGPAGTHDFREMFACITHQLREQKALTVVLPAIFLRQVMKLQQSIASIFSFIQGSRSGAYWTSSNITGGGYSSRKLR